jgi:hypothetical protein
MRSAAHVTLTGDADKFKKFLMGKLVRENHLEDKE